MKLSVVVCVYNEELNIKPLVEQISTSLEGMEYEIVYVDDGSTDNTVREIKSLNSKRIRLVEFKKNYGQSSALAAGIAEARGEYIATMDGDLQNDPSDIPWMLEKAEKEDWDVVAGIRANRQDGMVLRKIPSKIANWMIRTSTGVHMSDYGCTLRVFKSEDAKALNLYGELHRFIPVLAVMEGSKMTQVDVKHHARQHGVSKYGINRTFKVLSDLMLMLFFKKYMQKPMHLFGIIGVGVTAIGMLINFYMLALKFMGQDIWNRPLLMLGILATLGGIQFITIGIVAEIQMRTYYESQDKKPYRIKRITQGEN